MEDKEVTRLNKLIATYMGYNYYPFTPPTRGNSQTYGWWRCDPKIGLANIKLNKYLTIGRTHNDLRYRHDWNWLMAVMKEIETDGFQYMLYSVSNGSYEFSISRNSSHVGRTRKKSALEAVWYCVALYCEEVVTAPDYVQKTFPVNKLVFKKLDDNDSTDTEIIQTGQQSEPDLVAATDRDSVVFISSDMVRYGIGPTAQSTGDHDSVVETGTGGGPAPATGDQSDAVHTGNRYDTTSIPAAKLCDGDSLLPSTWTP